MADVRTAEKEMRKFFADERRITVFKGMRVCPDFG